jgi:hypothetical protein
VPRSNALKFGLATGAAIAGVILAITSVAAHSTQASTLHQSKSVVGSLIEAANSASLPFVAPDPALNGVRDSVELEAETDAAELLAAQQKEAAELAAEQAAAAAKAAEEAAEQAAQPACVATDQGEDPGEKTLAQAAEAAEGAEPTTEAADQTEDTAERATDLAEDKTEVPCNHGEGHDKVKVDNESTQGSDHEHSH